MLNYLWAGMIIVGVVFGAFRGVFPEITETALLASKEAVNLGITMLGIVSFWMGIMEIAVEAGIIEKMSLMFQPVVRFLFPKLPKDHNANGHIVTNIVANILGLGWAATPAGLQAMEELAKLEKERGNETGVASDEMCNFLILNISSLQLIPITMIAYRSQYGSSDPTRIVGPALLATATSTLVAIIFCKWMGRKRR